MAWWGAILKVAAAIAPILGWQLTDDIVNASQERKQELANLVNQVVIDTAHKLNISYEKALNAIQSKEYEVLSVAKDFSRARNKAIEQLKDNIQKERDRVTTDYLNKKNILDKANYAAQSQVGQYDSESVPDDTQQLIQAGLNLANEINK